jgi:hypothetical protein
LTGDLGEDFLNGWVHTKLEGHFSKPIGKKFLSLQRLKMFI